MPAISSDKPYRIGRSKTGLGLFATRPIKKGTKIIRYFGPMLDCRKEKDDAIENKYLFQINGRWTIDGSVRKNIARYINHSCRPNAESDVSARKRTVHIRAIKNIAPGDEINYDYGTEYFKEYLKPIGCKCAACERKRAKQRAEARAAKPSKKSSKKPSTTKSVTKAKKANAAKPAAKKASTNARSKPASAGKSRAPKAVASRRNDVKSVKTVKASPKKRARAA